MTRLQLAGSHEIVTGLETWKLPASASWLVPIGEVILALRQEIGVSEIGVFVGEIGVKVGGIGVEVGVLGGMGVKVGVGGIGVLVGDGVDVGVSVGGMGVSVGVGVSVGGAGEGEGVPTTSIATDFSVSTPFIVTLTNTL
jgi:hypothetical protein